MAKLLQKKELVIKKEYAPIMNKSVAKSKKTKNSIYLP